MGKQAQEKKTQAQQCIVLSLVVWNHFYPFYDDDNNKYETYDFYLFKPWHFTNVILTITFGLFLEINVAKVTQSYYLQGFPLILSPQLRWHSSHSLTTVQQIVYLFNDRRSLCQIYRFILTKNIQITKMISHAPKYQKFRLELYYYYDIAYINQLGKEHCSS